ncbi:type VI immunity family protein [Sorangium sp. So ce119]|uniref:type VI immunity family protein n=1 Tax=Sorangium sp. So ce119 TaxID=3133279 RepID=UPI003F6129F7
MTAGGAGPLLESEGSPVLFCALGLKIHLELLTGEDEERLDRVNDRVWAWYGDRLSLTWLSCAASPQRTTRSHLDYISSYASHLKARANPDPALQRAINNVTKFGRTEYDVSCVGASSPDAASPYTYAFWSEIGDVPDDSPDLPAHAMLELTVPDDHPLDVFFANVCAIVGELRVRWATAGLTYAAELRYDTEAPGDRIYAHARRYTGYDVGFHVGMMDTFFDRIRTVNWLTFLGPAMVGALAAAGRTVESTPHVQVSQVGSATLLRAGSAPLAGDVNYLAVPAAYREADALVRPIRASDGQDMVFFGPWDERSITRWLRRFEYSVG